MGKKHNHKRSFVECTECGRPLPARLIESGNEPYWQPIGVAGKGCPDCGNDEYEEVESHV